MSVDLDRRTPNVKILWPTVAVEQFIWVWLNKLQGVYYTHYKRGIPGTSVPIKTLHELSHGRVTIMTATVGSESIVRFLLNIIAMTVLSVINLNNSLITVTDYLCCY